MKIGCHFKALTPFLYRWKQYTYLLIESSKSILDTKTHRISFLILEDGFVAVPFADLQVPIVHYQESFATWKFSSSTSSDGANSRNRTLMSYCSCVVELITILKTVFFLLLIAFRLNFQINVNIKLI